MSSLPSFDEIFAVMTAASLGDPMARVKVPHEPEGDHLPSRVAIAVNGLLDGLAARVDEATAKSKANQSVVQQWSEGTFRALLEAAPDAMVIIGPDGAIALLNTQAEKLFGYSRFELLGQTLEKLVPVRLRAKHAQHRAGFFAGPKVRHMGGGLELYGLRKDGTEFPAEISLSQLETPTGMLVSSAIRDISERKRIELALAAANRELESFSYSVAHDLRAPLRRLNGFAQILLDDYQETLDAQGQDCLHEIRDSAEQMAALIDALLSLSGTTTTELNATLVDLTALARAVANQLADAEKHRRVEVVIEEGLSAHADPQLGRDLLYNLVSNAWKFTGKTLHPRIEVGSIENEGRRAFFVRDNGAGFDMAHAKKLFTPFQRLHAVEAFEGTGIGLATAQRIINRHGGRIWAEGAVDAGATFYFTLPSLALGAAQ